MACWNQSDCTTYAFRDVNGIDFDRLVSITDRFGEIDKNKAREIGLEVLPGDAWIEQDVDILVPGSRKPDPAG